MAIKECSVQGCGTGVFLLGLCRPHHRSLKRHGDPRRRRPKYAPPREKLLRGAVRQGECWEWSRARNSSGYGRLTVNGRRERVHRYAYQLFVGPIPSGMEVDHVCHNRACVAPYHLRLATRAQNNANRVGAQPASRSGHRNIHWDSRSNTWKIQVGKGAARRTSSRKDLGFALQDAHRFRGEVFGEFAGKG